MLHALSSHWRQQPLLTAVKCLAELSFCIVSGVLKWACMLVALSSGACIWAGHKLQSPVLSKLQGGLMLSVWQQD